MKNWSFYAMARNARNTLRNAEARIRLQRSRGRVLDVAYRPEALHAAWEPKPVSCVNPLYAEQTEDNPDIDLSFVIPVYNPGVYLRGLLESLANQQTDYRYEVICVNDGSTDSSSDVLNEFAERYPHVFTVIDKQNGGISSARNTGMDAARGRYLAFADDDDRVSPTFVQTLRGMADANHVDIVRGSHELVRNGRLTDRVRYPEIVTHSQFGAHVVDYPGMPWGGVYLRSLINTVRFPVGYWYEDMITRILVYRQAQSFASTGTVLYRKTQYGGNNGKKQGSDATMRPLEHVYLLRAIVDDSRRLGLEDDFALYLAVLGECSRIMAQRIRLLPVEIQQQAFLMARETLVDVRKPEYVRLLTADQADWDALLMNREFDAWRAKGGIR